LNQIVVDLENLKKEIETFKKRNIIYEFIMDPESKFSQEVLEKLRAELLDTVPKITKYKSDGWKISKNKNDIVLSNSNIQNQLDARNQIIDETKGKKKKFTEEITCERSKYSKKKGERSKYSNLDSFVKKKPITMSKKELGKIMKNIEALTQDKIVITTLYLLQRYEFKKK
jgi:flagellar biosynthesis chaperone FliJ